MEIIHVVINTIQQTLKILLL